MKMLSESRGLKGGTRSPAGFSLARIPQTRLEAGFHPRPVQRCSIVLLGLVLCALSGCTTSHPPKSAGRTPLTVRFYLETNPGEAAVTVQLPQSGVSLGVAPKPVFSEFDITNAEVARVDLGLCVLVQLTPAAKRDLYRLSVPAQGRRLVVSLNDVFLGVHRIAHAMADGVVPVFLEVPDEQLPGIVAQIKSASAEIARVTQKISNK